MAFTVDDWCEVTDNSADWEISPDASSGHIRISVDGNKLLDALRFILPTVKLASAGNSVRLIRSLPALWPFYLYDVNTYMSPLYASHISIKGFGSKDATKVPKQVNVILPVSPFITGGNTTTDIGAYYLYEKYELDIEFAGFRGFYVSDARVDANKFQIAGIDSWPEWGRNVEYAFNPLGELLTLEGSSLQFVENPDAPKPQTILGKGFPQPYPLIQTKAGLEFTWKDVPAEYILGNTGLQTLPRKFMNCFGKVNNDDFMKYKKHRLLLIDWPEFIPKTWAIIPAGVGNIVWPWLYDIKIKYRFFDPSKGKAASVYSGHLILPPRGQDYYLYATRVPFGKSPEGNTPDATAPGLFGEADFRQMFQYNNE